MVRAQRTSWQRPAKIGGLAGLVAAGLAGAAWISHRQARNAERRHLPLGRFITVKGVRLHYVERGRGPAVVFIHGNGAMVDDFIISGVFGLAAEKYRAIVFDRPGFGHSERPGDRRWTASAQAALLPEMFKLLGIDRAIVVGHSWGTLVALALALDHPRLVSGLVLASGYYFPTPGPTSPCSHRQQSRWWGRSSATPSRRSSAKQSPPKSSPRCFHRKGSLPGSPPSFRWPSHCVRHRSRRCRRTPRIWSRPPRLSVLVTEPCSRPRSLWRGMRTRW